MSAAEGWAARLGGLEERVLAGGLRVHVARGARSRTRGLAGLAGLPGNRALRLTRCPSVHTFGMRFALDLVWLDRRGAVVRVDRGVPPRRVRACLRARSVVECRGGCADEYLNAGVGDAYTGPR